MFLDFALPPELIAQHPVAERDRSRLLVLHRRDGRLEHRHFGDLPEYLDAGDLLVANDTRVLPARLIGRREKTGGKWEGLYLRTTPDGLWEMLTQTGGRPQAGEAIVVDPDLRLILRSRTESGWLVEPPAGRDAVAILERYGQMPLPPYIRNGQAEAADRERYQTVFARKAGSVAAPTAGLHFTEHLLNQLSEKGINQTYVTLHVGLGTFEPIRTEDYRDHRMHAEHGEVAAAAATAIAECKSSGHRVVAVGTTATRTLESAAPIVAGKAWHGETDLFIHPPYPFAVVDALITNFHLPRTTLLLLVGAFAGSEFLQEAYAVAIRERYRFFSYGDAMLIV